VDLEGKGRQYTLNHDDSLLVPRGSRFETFLAIFPAPAAA